MGYPDDYDSEPDQSYAPAQQYPEYAPEQYDPGYEAPPSQDTGRQAYTPWPYSAPAPQPNQAQPYPAPVEEAPVTLLFKDGRPPVQVHNYMLTSTTLSVLDQHRRDIPVDQIDLAATERVNHDAGIEFSIPGGTR